MGPIFFLAVIKFVCVFLVSVRAEQTSFPRTRLEERLKVADEALAEISLEGSADYGTCAAALPAIITDIRGMQLLLSSESEGIARSKAVAVRERMRNSDCLNLGRSFDNQSLHQQDLYVSTAAADRALEEVEMVLATTTATKISESILAADESTAIVEQRGSDPNRKQSKKKRPGKRPGSGSFASKQQCSEADGTTCQFSGCAQGRNLVSCSIGFAKGVIGGSKGQSYTVTSDQDNPENPPYGTLRHALNTARSNPGGVWITFSRDMIIELRAMLWVYSHTTVDGRGFNIVIRQHAVVMSDAKQVILENLQINSVRGGDTVHIFSNCWKVWVDHITSFGGDLGLVSVVQGSTDVTISNCKLSNHNFNMLLGASDHDYQDKNMRVSVYRNHFLDSMQRMPHCRWGWCHVANNLYTNWGYYAVGARVSARVKTENNVFMPSRASEVTPWHPGASFDLSARIESTGDLLTNGATFHQFLDATHDVRPPYPNGDYPPLISADKVQYLVSSCAGAQTPRTLYSCQRAAGVAFTAS